MSSSYRTGSNFAGLLSIRKKDSGMLPLLRTSWKTSPDSKTVYLFLSCLTLCSKPVFAWNWWAKGTPLPFLSVSVKTTATFFSLLTGKQGAIAAKNLLVSRRCLPKQGETQCQFFFISLGRLLGRARSWIFSYLHKIWRVGKLYWLNFDPLCPPGNI